MVAIQTLFASLLPLPLRLIYVFLEITSVQAINPSLDTRTSVLVPSLKYGITVKKGR